MSEYIKREDAINKAREAMVGGHLRVVVLLSDLNAIPAADVVERSDDLVRVVRCSWERRRQRK